MRLAYIIAAALVGLSLWGGGSGRAEAALTWEQADALVDKAGVGDQWALAALREEAAQGNVHAQTKLGFLYVQGTGVPQDYAEALIWYRKAAEQGGADAQYSLGSFYMFGFGVPKDKQAAQEWYRKAAAQGHPHAQKLLRSLIAQAEPGGTDKLSPGPVEKTFAPVADRVRTIIAAQLGLDKRDVVSGAALAKDLGADELDQAELMIALEEAFAIEIPDRDAKTLITVGQVIEYLAEATQRRPASPVLADSPEQHVKVADRLADEGDRKGAIAEYQAALRLKPDFLTAHLNLGVTYFEDRQWDKAIGEYREVLRLDPTHHDAWLNLGLAYKAKGDLGKAINAFQEAARLKPESAPAHEQLGVAWFTKGDFGKAAKAFRQVLRVKKGDAGAYYNLGMALIKKGDPAGAAEALRQAVKLKPKNSRAKLFLSEILLDTASKDIAAKEQATGIVGLGMMNLNKDLTEALTLGEQVVEEEPDNEEAHLVLAEAYAQKVDNGHAEEHYTAVLRLNPRNVEAVNNLGVLLARQGRHKEASVRFREAARLDPNNPSAKENMRMTEEAMNQKSLERSSASKTDSKPTFRLRFRRR